MRINIELEGNSLARWDFTNPIIIPETLELAFTSLAYKLENVMLMVSIYNRTQDKFFQFKSSTENNHIVDVSEAVGCGELEVEVSSFVSDGIPTKTWRTPKIVVREIEAKFEAIPELTELRRAIGEIKGILEKNNLI